MRKLIILFALSCIFPNYGNAVQVLFDYAVFYTPEDQPFVELNIQIPSSDLILKKENGESTKSAVFVITFLQDEEIKQFDKFRLTTTDDNNLTVIKRFEIDTGHYELMIEAFDASFDASKEAESYKSVTSIEVPPLIDNELLVADILLYESIEATDEENEFSKLGFNWIPYPLGYYPNEFTNLVFYSEIYGTKDYFGEMDFLIRHSLLNANEQVLGQYSSFKKTKSNHVIPSIGKFDIESLQSNSYYILIEVVDQSNIVVASKRKTIHRNNKAESVGYDNLHLVELNRSFAMDIPSADLLFYTRSLNPIANDRERIYLKNVVVQENSELMRKFIDQFFVSRNPNAPAELYEHYRKAVDYAEIEFGGNLEHGFDTDRGRVYLKNGLPDNRHESANEPGAFPYEVWHYYNLNGVQSNVQFIFVNDDYVTESYFLIHSDAIGEVKDENWEVRVYGDDARNKVDFDRKTNFDTFGRNRQDY